VPVPNSMEGGAYNPQVLPPQPEVLSQSASFEAAPEKLAQQEAQPTSPSQGMPMLPAPTVQAPKPTVAPLAPPIHPLMPSDGNPSTASDEEVIEKEWVDKAKKIITQTKDDPYKQEKEVSKLQADYLKKRYGKEIKVVEN